VTVRSVQNRGGEQGRSLECVAANQIEDQEPDGDDDGADDAGDRAIDNDPRPRVFHMPRHARPRRAKITSSLLN
jgi:hypothetical protein